MESKAVAEGLQVRCRREQPVGKVIACAAGRALVEYDHGDRKSFADYPIEDLETVADTASSVPLTPALSPGEREKTPKPIKRVESDIDGGLS